MIRTGGIWALGLAGSALSHAAAGLLLLAALAPDPVPEQPSPQSRLNLQAHRVSRSQAVPQAAQGAAAAEARPRGQGLVPGAIPQSRAAPARPDIAAAAAAAPQPVALAAAHVPAAPAAAAPPPAAAAAQVAAESAPAAVAAAPVLVAAAAAPAARPVLPAAPAGLPSPALRPDAQAIAGSRPAAQPATAAIPDTPVIKAALAFQGADGGEVDPVSLAAFQSFMRPGDAAGGDPLRDGLAGVLAAVPCSRLQVAFDPETATLELRGHLPEDGLRAPVLAALQARMGQDITVSDQMRLLPRPQCGALAGIANAGLPQSTDQITNPLLVGADAHARVLDYAGGERLFFDLTAPDYPAYVYADYFDAGGAVLHLAPNETVPLARSPAQARLRIGAQAAGDPGLQISVGPPYGQEIAVAFAASHPLYDGVRPVSEPAGPYLDWLRGRIANARAQHEDFKGEWVYFLVTTHPP